MMRLLKYLDRHLARIAPVQILILAVCGVLIVGAVDYFTGYEVSVSFFYLGPVALAAWYARRQAGIAIAVLSCISWYVTDLADHHPYSKAIMPVWNALVRLGFFLTTALLLSALRDSLRNQAHLARTDGLTGLQNRRAFDDRLGHDVALAQRRKTALTLAYVDVDELKHLNDSHGHASGDRALKVVGGVLSELARKSDTAARIGGDEFALVLPETDDQGARQFITRLTDRLHEVLAANDLRITCSIGVVTFPDANISPETALAAADKLMYRVKKIGKSAVEFSVPSPAIQLIDD